MAVNHNDGAGGLWVGLGDPDGVALIDTIARRIDSVVLLAATPYFLVATSGRVWASLLANDEVVMVEAGRAKVVVSDIAGPHVLGVAGQVWATGRRAGRRTTLKIDPVTSATTPVEVEGRPLCGSSSGLLLSQILYKDRYRISYLDLATGARSVVIEGGLGAVNLADDRILVTYWGPGKGMIAAATSGTRLSDQVSVELPPDIESPGTVVLTVAGVMTAGMLKTSVYPKGGPLRMDVLHQLDWPSGRSTGRLEMDPIWGMAVVGDELWISQPYRRRLVVIDPATMSEVATVDLPGQPHALVAEVPPPLSIEAGATEPLP